MIDIKKDVFKNLKQRAALYKSANNKINCELIKEKCKRDIKFWINMFCWTYNPDLNYMRSRPFILYDFQEEAIDEICNGIENGEDIIIEKSRKMGITWLILYIQNYYWQFHNGYSFLLSSKKEDDIDKQGVLDTLFEKIRFNIRLQPFYLLSREFDKGRDLTYMRLVNKENNCVIHGHAPGMDLGRSGRVSAVFLDEFASWDFNKANGSWTALTATTRCRIVVSTPKGSSNLFARLAHNLEGKKRKILSYHWTLHPIFAKDTYYYDKNKEIPVPFKKANILWKSGIEIRSPWYDIESKRYETENELAQELDINYLMSGRPYFHMQSLLLQKEWKYVKVNLVLTQRQIHIRRSDDGIFKIFELPKPDVEYVIGADTAEGLEKRDECFAVVRDKVNYNVVATINKIIPPEDFAEYLYYLSLYYREALIACELNNHGYTTNLELHRLGANLYYTKISDKNIKRGFLTSTKTRSIMLNKMANHLRNNIFYLRDITLIQQCKTFIINKNGKMEADGDFLDDGVMACAIAGQVIEERPMKNKNLQRNFLFEDRIRTRKNAGFGSSL